MFSHNNIITATIMFGSVHMLSTAVKELNKKWINCVYYDFTLFEIMNLSIGLIAGIVLINGCKGIENRYIVCR
jgi:hypothetical protein